jgi:uncharacterized integral membrane protein
MRRGQWVVLVLAVLGSALFAFFNAGQRITLSLGFVVFYRLSLVNVVFGAFVLGMVCMFLIGLRQDLRMRQQLRERGLLDSPSARPPPEPEPEREEPDATHWPSHRVSGGD